MTVSACPPNAPAPFPGVVAFSVSDFRVIYPEFSTSASDAQLTNNFTMATTQLDNSCGSRVQDVNLRQTLLYLLTAHITAVMQGTNTSPATGLVGRVSGATEGSVSAQIDAGAMLQGQAFYMQTQYGFLYWQATARFRTFVNIPAPRRSYGPLGSLYAGPCAETVNLPLGCGCNGNGGVW